MTEGQVEDEIPLEKSSYYITHNSQNGEQYKDLKNITLQLLKELGRAVIFTYSPHGVSQTGNIGDLTFEYHLELNMW